MRKARKKRIVAMTLALSMLASSAGTCASAAAGPTEEDSGLEVTLVPLGGDSAPAQEDAPETPAGNGERTSDENPEAPVKDPEQQPEEETPEDGTSSDEPGIERPEQSDTVETLPGTAEDNKGHIKGEETKDDKPSAPEETAPSEGGGNSTGTDGNEMPDQPGKIGGTEEGQTASSEVKTPETDGGEKAEDSAKGTETDKTAEDDGKKEPETEEDDDLDYSCAYDPDTGHFKITFNIKEDATGDQIIELSKVQEVVNKYGKGYLDTDAGKKQLEKAEEWNDKTMKYTYNGVDYVYDLTTGEVRMRNEPGCTTVFDVSLSNGSKHTYVYKNNSFTVATPDMKNDDKTGITGFDGQELPKDYVGNTKLQLKYSKTAESGCMEDLVDAALKEFDEDHKQNQFLDADGNLTTTIQNKATLAEGSEVIVNKKGSFVKITSASGEEYYYKLDSANAKLVKEVDGKTILTDTVQNTSVLYNEKGEKDYYIGHYDRQNATLVDIRPALEKYMAAYGYSSYDDYILDYYKKPDGTKYDSVEELLRSNKDAQASLLHSGNAMPGNSSKNPNGPLGNASSSMDPSTIYDNFYNNILSFKVGDPDKVDSEASGNEDHGHSHGNWASDKTQETIGDYMVGKLNETGSWAKANEYFQTLLLSGMSEEEATWAAFAMATNIDFKNAGNDYQNTAWSWYASMVLHQADGTLHLNKTDKDGNIIGDDEGEGQTSFYLWKYETETDDDGNETEVPMYCTYVEPTYSTNDAGEQVLEKEGFYCWVKYDPAEDKMNYTITTTNGSLNIDYALLENVVYYLQEALAPEGYDADPNIYVICDEDTYNEMVSSGAFDNVENPAGNTSGPVAGWLGSITGGETLTYNFVNAKSAPTPDPDPEPGPKPDPDIPPVGPDEPDVPVSPEEPDLPPVQDDQPAAPVPPQSPEAPAAQGTLPQTGTTSWLAGVLMSFGSALTACGWFFTRRQRAPRH